MEADQDGDGKLSFEEFSQTVANTVCLIFMLLFSLLYLGSIWKTTLAIMLVCSGVYLIPCCPSITDVYVYLPFFFQDIVKQMTLEDLF